MNKIFLILILICFNCNAKQEEDHKKLGPIGEQLGLVWGGRWKSLIDIPHFELHPNGKTWRDLRPQLLVLGISNYKKLNF